MKRGDAVEVARGPPGMPFAEAQEESLNSVANPITVADKLYTPFLQVIQELSMDRSSSPTPSQIALAMAIVKHKPADQDIKGVSPVIKPE